MTTLILIRLLPVAALAFLVFHPAWLATARQSGRIPDPAKPKVKPVPPDPLPRRRPNELPKDDESIRISTDLVTVVTAVSRSGGGSVADLQKEDFEVFEDGRLQEVANFARVSDVPLSMVLLFDTSLSIASRLDFERRAAARFVERIMRPQDRAALFGFATDVTVLQDFTNRVPMIINAMKHLDARGATSLYDAIYFAADHVKPAPGRHVLVIISDGGDTTSNKDLKQALTQAQLSDSVVYAIYTGDRMPSENLRDMAAERALLNLTSETGGEAYFPITRAGRETDWEDRSLQELNQAFSRIEEQLRTQYTLGFYSTNESRDGAFRRLSVRVKKPGYAVRARLGYYSGKP